MKKKILVYEAMGFCILIVLIWINEIADIPYLLFKAQKTPVNFTESIAETVIVLILAIITILVTRKLLRRIKYLEGFIRMCSVCNKVYDKYRAQWVELKDYLNKNYELEFTHGFCPECMKNIHVKY
jgi:hypothetical protein